MGVLLDIPQLEVGQVLLYRSNTQSGERQLPNEVDKRQITSIGHKWIYTSHTIRPLDEVVYSRRLDAKFNIRTREECASWRPGHVFVDDNERARWEMANVIAERVKDWKNSFRSRDLEENATFRLFNLLVDIGEIEPLEGLGNG